MTFGRRAVLPVDLTMEDNLSAPAAQAKAALAGIDNAATRTGSTLAGIGDKLESARPKIRELGRAGGELANVADAIGGHFGAAGQQIGEFTRLAADAGLVVTTIADIGPQAIKSAQSILGIGQAATATAPALNTLAAAEDLAGTNATSMLTRFGPLGLVLTELALVLKHLADGGGDLDTSINQTKQDLVGYVESAGGASTATVELAGHVDESTHHLDTLTESLIKAGSAAEGVGLQVGNFAGNVEAASADVLSLNQIIDDLPRDISIKINVGLFGEGAGVLTQGFTQPLTLTGSVQGAPKPVPFSPLPTTANQEAQTLRNLKEAQANALKALQTNTDPSKVRDLERAYRDATEAISNFYKAQADQRASQAKQRAEELARIYKDRVAKEFSNAEKVATTLFDSLHAKHVRAINDAEKLAEKQHDANVQAIQDNLKAQLTANAAPVTAAEKAQQDIENARQLRDLRESLQAAQQNLANLPSTATAEERQAAQRDVRNAQEAIQSFQAGQKIADLKAEQDRKDALAQDAATAATAAEDAKLAAAQRQQIIDLAKEEKADRQKRADFEKALADLERRDKGKPVSVIDADIAALEKKFGIFTDPETGAHHIGDAVALAVGNTIRNLKVEPHIEVKVEPHFRVEIDRRGDVSVTQATSVRSAQAVRRFA